MALADATTNAELADEFLREVDAIIQTQLYAGGDEARVRDILQLVVQRRDIFSYIALHDGTIPLQ